MNKPIDFVPLNQAEQSKAFLVLLAGVLGILSACLSLWVGFRLAESAHAEYHATVIQPAPQPALHIITASREQHGQR